MFESDSKHYLCIEGNIGTGKTTLCKMLAQDYNCQLVLEQFTDNPFLPQFYKQPERYAFPVELFFMSERYKQLQEYLINRDFFYDFILSDYFFHKTALFAQNNLNSEEYKLFLRFFSILKDLFPKPDLLVYLHRPVEQLHKQIKRRNRRIEDNIKPDYLRQIESAYFSFFQGEVPFPVVIINLSGVDFASNRTDYQKMKDIMSKSYNTGIHEVNLGRS